MGPAEYVHRTTRHRSAALLCEVALVSVIFLTGPLFFGATFQLRYGRLLLVPLVLGMCVLDAWARRRWAKPQ
jgi:hypothetical protein